MSSLEYQRLYHRRRYADRVAEMKSFLGGKCVVCGAMNGLEIHHKDPKEKVFVLTSIYSHPWQKIVAELGKCELRCEPHHQDRHSTEHGRIRMYKNGCRCDLCVEKVRAAGRKDRAASRARQKLKRL
jgi:hypothetical protein